jgi:glycosyltransferase involved in cell wall biosynthesis
MVSRICFISESIRLPLDEGLKKTAHQLLLSLAAIYPESWALIPEPLENLPIANRVIQFDRFFKSAQLRNALEASKPELILYLPYSSDTLMSFWRARQLASQSGAKVAIICTQPKRHCWLTRLLLPWLQPHAIFVSSHSRRQYYKKLGIKACFTPLGGINLDAFLPLKSDHEKHVLRQKLGFSSDKKLILHVGHCRPERNLEILKHLKRDDREIVLITSTSTQADPVLKAELEQAGVKVINQYFPSIEALYQISDAYIFPVQDPEGAIEFPLSVLEALACDIPVLTTPFGVLPELFQEGQGVYFFQDLEDAKTKLEAICGKGHHGLRDQVVPFDWRNIIREIIKQCLS